MLDRPSKSNVAQRGFTLIELMIVIVMVAILATIAAPSFQDSISRNKRQSSLEETFNMLRKARGEAAAKSTNSAACASEDSSTCSGDNTWESGYIVFLDNGLDGGTAGDGVRDPNEPLMKVGEAAPPGITIRGVNFPNDGVVAFNPQGTTGDRGTFQICDSRGGAGRASAVILNRSGQPRIATDEDGDGPVNTDAGPGNNVGCP